MREKISNVAFSFGLPNIIPVTFIKCKCEHVTPFLKSVKTCTFPKELCPNILANLAPAYCVSHIIINYLIMILIKIATNLLGFTTHARKQAKYCICIITFNLPNNIHIHYLQIRTLRLRDKRQFDQQHRDKWQSQTPGFSTLLPAQTLFLPNRELKQGRTLEITQCISLYLI